MTVADDPPRPPLDGVREHADYVEREYTHWTPRPADRERAAADREGRDARVKDYSTGRRTSETVDVCITVDSSTPASEAITAGGGLLGMNTAKSRPPERFPLDFLDFDFKSAGASFANHRAIVERERPRYAVAPDIEGRDAGRVFEQADDLNRYAETVIVVPKDIHPREVPSRFRVGLPFSRAFGTTMPDPELFVGVGPVHILGGSPTEQRTLYRRLRHEGLEVGSVDTSLPVLYARKGRVWYDRGQFGRPNVPFKQRLRASVEAMRAAWNPRLGITPSIPLEDWEEEPPEYLFHPQAPPRCQHSPCFRAAIADTEFTFCEVHQYDHPDPPRP